MGTDDIALWPFAVKHAVWLYNCGPKHESGLTPFKSTVTYYVHMCGAVLRMCLNLSSKMARSFPSGIVDPDLVSS
jgi:hypothetical protein